MAVDVAIVGGGVMGAAAAFWLTRMQPGLRVIVLERDPTHARAATALSVASIRQQFSNPLNVAISGFGLEVIRDFAALAGPGAPDLGLRENGYLFLAGTTAAAAAMRAAVAVQHAAGAATELLAPPALAARFPWLALEDVILGSFGPRGEGWFDNMGLLSGFRDAARAQGAVWRRAEVAALHRDGARVTGVRLACGTTLAAGAVVLAAGTRAAGLMAGAGHPWPVEPRKRTVFLIDAPDARHPDAPLLVDHTGFYLRPEGRHWLCATVPTDDPATDPDDFEPRLEEFEDVVWPRIWARAPEFAAVKVLRAWAGLYDFNTLDQNAIVGPHPQLAGLHVLSGFSGHGLQQAPAMGRGLAEVLLTGAYRTLDLSPLGVARVLEGRAFPERAVV
ncbi:NAD(P)/FAD-dependent oxidoreductase [Rhodobaculum claviforme]|uniref:Amino acid oxidase n=1 Tax=Rhodobaculum claviforme TaxID=1549854 RepID=A0A934TJ92_9RHOB|nr:FAD-binding oxidoreductase [Rhodobaculum claviforme]MBK5926633.1 amino acid oxidase [Rhodobaculum claviforme]